MLFHPRLFLAAVLAACSAPPSTPNAEAAAPAAPAVASVAPAGARAFAAGATFADLVRSLRDDPAAKPGRACLLSPSGDLTFEAPVALGRPTVPDPPTDLDVALEVAQQGAVRLWASWGDTEGGDLLDLVALTPLSQAARSTTTGVLAVTDKGTYFLAVGMPSSGLVVTDSDVSRIKKEIVPKAAVWVITAEAGVPLEKLREPLGWIAETKGTVVLATASLESLGPVRRISRYDAKVQAGQPEACDLAEMQKPGPQPGKFASLGCAARLWGSRPARRPRPRLVTARAGMHRLRVLDASPRTCRTRIAEIDMRGGVEWRGFDDSTLDGGCAGGTQRRPPSSIPSSSGSGQPT